MKTILGSFIFKKKKLKFEGNSQMATFIRELFVRE